MTVTVIHLLHHVQSAQRVCSGLEMAPSLYSGAVVMLARCMVLPTISEPEDRGNYV